MRNNEVSTNKGFQFDYARTSILGYLKLVWKENILTHTCRCYVNYQQDRHGIHYMNNQECKLQHSWFAYLTCREVGPSKFTDPSSSSTWTTTAGGTLPGGYKAHLQQSPKISATDSLHFAPVWFAAECVDWCLSHSEKNYNFLHILGILLQAFQLFAVLYPKQQCLLHRQDISAKIFFEMKLSMVNITKHE